MPGGGNLVRTERFRKAPRTPRTAHARYYYTRSLVLDSPIRKRSTTPRIRCQSAPKVMDSHSRSASPREPMRPQHRPPSPPSASGAFDNRAYQHDESDQNHNESFSSNGPHQNGHTKDIKGSLPDPKTLEAVNLELINLTPKNGSMKKKDVEVDMNTQNPYDEYFVPVNEHRKYMRGEKLYVTADKRGEKGGCKRPLCWTLLGLAVAAIVAIIVLAATGVLFTNSPTPLEQYNTSVSSARALSGISHVQQVHNHEHDRHEQGHDHDHANHEHEHHEQLEPDQSAEHEQTTEQSEPQHGPEPQSDEGREPLREGSSDETNESSMYVPRTVEGELKVDNEEFSAALQDTESNEYREFVSSFANGIKRAIFDRNNRDNEQYDISVEVVQLRQGSVIVTYRVHWKPKLNSPPTEDLLNAYKLGMKLEDYLSKNNRMINIYHIAEDKFATKPVLDMCQINKFGCEHDCEFDETTLDFTCTCPPGQISDMTNPKKCMSLLDPEARSEENTKFDFSVLTVNSTQITAKSTPEEEIPTTEHITEHTFDWKETHHRMPETTTEVEPDVNFSHIFGNPTEKPEEEPEPARSRSESSEETHAPTTTAEPKPEPEPTAEPHPTPEPEPAQKSEPVPEPKTVPEPEPKSEGDMEQKSESEPKPEPEPTAEPEPEPEPLQKTIPEPEPEPKPEPEPSPDSKLEHEETESTTPSVEAIALNPAFIFQREQLPEAHTTEEPEQKQELQPETDQSDTTTQTSGVSVDIQHNLDPENVLTAQGEPESEPTSITEEPKTTMAGTNHDSGTQPDSGNSEEKSILYTNEGKFEYKPNEEIETLETTTMRISISEPNIINEPSYEPKPEIISILSDTREPEEPTTLKEDAPTTEITDWLEKHTQNHIESLQNQTEFEAILNNNIKNMMSGTEQRSFKAFDEDYTYETTTAMNAKITNEDYSYDPINKDNVTPETDITRRMEDDTKLSVSIMSNTKTTTIASTTPSSNIDMSKTIIETDSDIDENEFKAGTVNETQITSILEEAESLSTNKTTITETTTLEPEPIKEFSINKHYQDSGEDKLIAALENKPHIANKDTATEREPEEGMDITFDAISMLYNRSSKSIEKEPKKQVNNDIKEITEELEPMGETTVSSTDSDWLSEPVTEVNYDEAMNKMEKHETTEPTMHKIEDIMNHGLVKDDFEPDYLNNMGSGSNKPDQDEPLYGIGHGDYDNEDTRFKRVNKEVTPATANNTGTDERQKEIEQTTTERNATSHVLIETTTVSEYIYKVAEQSVKDPEITLTTHSVINKLLSTIDKGEPAPTTEAGSTSTINTSSTSVMSTDMLLQNAEPSPAINPEPAPVWEELETEKDLGVKNFHKIVEEHITTQAPDMIDEIQLLSSIVNSTTPAPMKEISENIITTTTETENAGLSESPAENTTQLNNLNVTIYEISSHSGNNSVVLAKPANALSAEYDEHEIEMNPFLPEVENNKSLVKKLQEGHDLEPTNLTETQNENTEEHAISSSEGRTLNKDIITVPEKDTVTKKQDENLQATTEDDTSFNELLMNVNSHENETEVTDNVTEIIPPAIQEKTNDNLKRTKPEGLEPLPVSTFLMDTDDLIISKDPATATGGNKLDSEPVAAKALAPVVNHGELLSVVPLQEDQEFLLKKHKSRNIEEFNDISDLPKSDKRTLDSTKFDSVTNNEA